MDKEFAEFIEKEELNIEAAFVEEFGLDERKMTDGEKEEREEIVKKLKPKLQSFKDRYGDDAKKVMYATATKQAMEEFKIDEGWKKGKYKVTDTKSGKVLGTFNSGGKAQKFVDDLFQKGDYESLTVELDEAVELEEKKSSSGYELYHKTFSAAMQHAYDHAKSKGHIVDPKEIDDKVATGPKKPSSGKTNRYSLKAGRKKVEIQVANLDNKRYELNMYIEGVELDEEVFYWYIVQGNTQKGKVSHVGTERQLKLKIRKPIFPSGHLLLKSRKRLKVGDKWKGSYQPEEVEVDETTNSVGGGNVAGLGVGAQGEPGARPRKKKKMIDESVKMSRFAGKDVFIVDSDTYHACRLGKKQYARYEKYVGKNRIGLAIREYGLKYPKRPIILQNGDSGPMLYLKYGRS